MSNRITASEARAQADAYELSKDDILEKCYSQASAASQRGNYKTTGYFKKRVATTGEIKSAAKQLEKDGYSVSVGEQGEKRTIGLSWSEAKGNPGKGNPGKGNPGKGNPGKGNPGKGEQATSTE